MHQPFQRIHCDSASFHKDVLLVFFLLYFSLCLNGNQAQAIYSKPCSQGRYKTHKLQFSNIILQPLQNGTRLETFHPKPLKVQTQMGKLSLLSLLLV